jgi:hypothetical protein
MSDQTKKSMSDLVPESVDSNYIVLKICALLRRRLSLVD